jgi:hypothetical protein
VLFLLWRVRGIREPGLRLIIPVVNVTLRIVTMPIQSQGVITRDNVSVDVSAAAYYRFGEAGAGAPSTLMVPTVTVFLRPRPGRDTHVSCVKSCSPAARSCVAGRRGQYSSSGRKGPPTVWRWCSTCA